MNVFIFTIGLFLGSFLNSFIWRFRMKMLGTIVHERSVCPHCKHVLESYDLIPVLSFLMLGGRCRYCRKPISWQYPAVELFFAILTLLIFWHFGWSILLITAIISAFLLTALMMIDILDGILPNKLLIVLIITVFFHLVLAQASTQLWFEAIWGALIGFGFYMALWLVTIGKGMGMGDVKLGLVLGMLAGANIMSYSIVLSFILGSLYVLPLMMIGAKSWKSKVPFGPFMILAYYAVFFLGDRIFNF